MKKYEIQGINGQKLEAKLLNEQEKKSLQTSYFKKDKTINTILQQETVQLIYINASQDEQINLYANGKLEKRKVIKGPGIEDIKGDTFLKNHEKDYKTLGPDLNKQIPETWKQILGDWIKY